MQSAESRRVRARRPSHEAAVQRKRFIFGPSLVPTSEGALTKTLQAEGVFPLPLDALWRLLHAHLDHDRIREIHPWILSGRTIRDGEPVEFQGLSFPREKVVERVIRVGIRRSKTTWTYRIDPPTRYQYEIAHPNGSLTRFDNTYSPFPQARTVVRGVVDREAFARPFR